MAAGPFAFDLLVLLDRCQPFHAGHGALVRQGLAAAKRVLVLIGSSRASRSCRNPFRLEERAWLVRAGLPGVDMERVEVAGVADDYDQGAWLSRLREVLDGYAAPGTRVGRLGRGGPGGWDDDQVNEALFPAGVLAEPGKPAIRAADIRDCYFSRPDWQKILAGQMSDEAIAWLARFAVTPDYQDLREEWQSVRDYRAPFAVLPWEPAFWTGDALLRAGGRLLMIRRSRAPGKGLWALPGGFVERHEFSLDAVVREVEEETRLRFPPEVLAGKSLGAYLKSRAVADQVFEYPFRSVRGRINTRAYLFDLECRPDTSPTEEALEMAWFSPEDIDAMAEQVFEDHALLVRAMVAPRVKA